jgi:alkaline phosphatase D
MASRGGNRGKSLRLNRRQLLEALGMATASLAVPGVAAARTPVHAKFPSYPFTLGVASGDPTPDGFVIWTRLVPFGILGGMLPDPVYVDWEVAEDPRFRSVAQRGTAIAWPQHAHSVHVELRGLRPGRSYWYRFLCGGAESRHGRGITAPVIGSHFTGFDGGPFRFAYASCQHYEQGYYVAYRDMIAQDPHLILHLGDYIYESSWLPDVRRHEGGEAFTLDDYRARHALYKLDPDLQAAHAHTSWAVTWDDHEVANDYAGPHSQHFDDPAVFLRRRAAAYRAYWEHMPLRGFMRPEGPAMRLYNRVVFGDLIQFAVLDDRQYRDNHACSIEGEGGNRRLTADECPELFDPKRTMLGAQQKSFLSAALTSGVARWNVVAQQTLFSDITAVPPPERSYPSEPWAGYPAARDRVIEMLSDDRTTNPVIIGGDLHGFFCCDVKRDFADPRSPTVAAEIVGTSITSQGFPYEQISRLLPLNPHIRFVETRHRGYVGCEVTPEAIMADLRVVDDIRNPDAATRSLRRFVIENGRPGLQDA